jgi:hypothetical protein
LLTAFIAIAQEVGLSKRTVQRALRTATFLGRKRRSDCGQSLLDPYKAALVDELQTMFLFRLSPKAAKSHYVA